jgi:ATP phosphoribosyltransferase regulatory subunit
VRCSGAAKSGREHAAMTETYESLRRLLSDAGYEFVEPPVVHPASVFVELAGEDLRRRLYLTSAEDGTELALRPDYTIPVTLHHLAAGKASRKANYAYLGPVFRMRPGESGEFRQAGIESFGRTDRVAADADVLKLAFAVADLFRVKRPKVRIGDSALFAAALDQLDLSEPWRRRLARTFGDTKRLKGFIAKANGKTKAKVAARHEMEGADRGQVTRGVEEIFGATGLGGVGRRTAEEIADRFVEKAALAEGIKPRAAGALSAFLAISGAPEKSLAALRDLAKREKLDLSKAIDRFEKRADAFAGHGVDLERLSFAADFGRRLDYYTGFVFEFQTGKTDGPIIGGGRYDRMTALIGDTGEAVPAVGFSVWLDRIGGKP